MNKQPRMIEADKLLAWISGVLLETDNEPIKYILSAAKDALKEGKFDHNPIPVPTIKHYDNVRHTEYGKGWVKQVEGTDAWISFDKLDYDLLLPTKQLELIPNGE